MRALLFICLATLLGTLAMPDAVPADEKKTDKYPEKVTIRVMTADGKFFSDREIPIRRGDDGLIYTNPAKASGNTTPTKGSEITDKDGVVWIVTKSLKQATSEYKVTVEKKK